MKDLLILGASNEIMKEGWVKYLSDLSVENASVGGCSSMAAIAMYGIYSFKPTNFTIINFELNEHQIINRKLRTVTEVENIWGHLISARKSAGSVPIVMTLPRIVDGNISSTITCDLHMNIAIKHNVLRLDLATAFMQAVKFGGHVEKLMSDESHLSKEAHKIVGDFVRSSINSMNSGEKFKVSGTFISEKFHHVIAKDVMGFRHIHKVSSHSSADMIEIREPGVLCVNLPEEGMELVGISLNRKSEGASVSMGNNVKIVKFQQSGQDGFMRVVTDIKNWKCPGRTLEITFQPISKDKATEPTWLSGIVSNSDACSLEVESFILRQSNKEEINFEYDMPAVSDMDLLKSDAGEALIRDLSKI